MAVKVSRESMLKSAEKFLMVDKVMDFLNDLMISAEMVMKAPSSDI